MKRYSTRQEVLFLGRLLDYADETNREALRRLGSEGSTALLPQAQLLAARIAVARDLAREAREHSLQAARGFSSDGRNTSAATAEAMTHVLDLATALPSTTVDPEPLAVAEALALRARLVSPTEAVKALTVLPATVAAITSRGSSASMGRRSTVLVTA